MAVSCSARIRIHMRRPAGKSEAIPRKLQAEAHLLSLMDVTPGLEVCRLTTEDPDLEVLFKINMQAFRRACNEAVC